MTYRFNGTDYTEDQMTKVADVKGYTLEELISKNPQIETITDDEVEKTQVVAEDAAPVTADTPAVEDTELVSEDISSDGQPTDPPWKPTKINKDGEIDHDYYEALGTFGGVSVAPDLSPTERQAEYESYLRWQEVSLKSSNELMLEEQREMNKQVLSNNMQMLELKSNINNQIDLSFSDLGEIETAEDFLEDSKQISGDIINQDKVIRNLIDQTNSKIENYNKAEINKIKSEFDIDIKKLVKEIEGNYDLSNADGIQAAENDLKKRYEEKLKVANKSIEEAQQRGEEFKESQINALFNSKKYNARVDLLNGLINEKIEPLWQDWQKANAGGLASFYGFTNATDQLIAGTYEIGKNWEASKVSIAQLAIKGVKQELDLLNFARSKAGFTDPNQTIYIYPDGKVDYQRSNIKTPETISQAPSTPRAGRFTLKGELDTSRQGAFGEVQSKPVKYKDYVKLQENKIENFKNDIKINVEEIGEFDKLINLVEPPELFDEDGATVNDVIGVVFRMAPQLGASITGAALAPATGGSSLLASTMFMFSNEYGSAYWQGVTQALSKELKRQPTNEEIIEAMVDDKYQNQGSAAGWATVSAILEQGTGLRANKALSASKKSIENFAKKLGYKDLKEFIVKTNKNQIAKTIKNKSKKIVDKGFEAFQEGGVEVLQEAGQIAAINAAKGDASFKDININDLKEPFGGGFTATLVIPQFGKMMRAARISYNYVNEQAYKVSIGKVKAEQRDQFFKDANNVLLQLKNNNKINEETFQAESKRLAALKNNSKKIPKNFSLEATQKSLDLMLERDKLQAKINNEDAAFTSPDKERLREVNNELLEIGINEDKKAKAEITKRNIDAQMGQVLPAKGIKVPADSRVIIVTNENAQQLANQYGVSVESLLADGDTEGAYIADKGVILMSETAAKDVLKHEGLHNYLDIALNKPGNENVVFGMAEVLMEKMRNQDPKIFNEIQNQLNKYRDNPNIPPSQVAEEVITYYGQLKDRGYFNAKENKPLLQQFIDSIKSLLENLGFRNVEINEGNVDTIIDNYINNIEKGGLTAAQRKIARGNVVVSPEIEARGETSFLRDTKVVEEPLAMAAAKKLSADKTTQVDNDITSLQQEIKENTEVAKRMGKEPIPTPKQQRLEAKIREDIKPTVDSFVESQTKRLYDPIPANIKQDIDRNTFKQTMQNDIESMVFNEYEVEKQDIEKFITSRGFLRANSLASRLGIPSVEEGPSTDVTEVKGLVAEETTEPDTKTKPTPKSRIPREFPEIITPSLKEDVETAALEIFESETPDVSDKQFKNFLTETFRGKLTKPIKDALGTGKNYEFTVKKLAPKMKELLPVQWFVRLESQTKPENRLFTKPPKRLTKQEDIDAAMQDDKVYVENTAQGVNLYEFKDFTPKQLIDYLLAPAISPVTGKRSGLRGTRKTTVAEGVVDVLGKDVTPQTVRRVERTKDKAAEISRKVQRDPSMQFAKKFDSKNIKELEEISALRSKIQVARVLGFDGSAINEKGRPKFLSQMLKAAEKGQIDVATIEAALMTSGGKQTFYGTKGVEKKYDKYGDAVKAGIKNPLKYAKRTNGEYVVIGKPKNVNGKILYITDEKIRKEINKYSDYVPKNGRLYWGAKDPNYITLLNTAKKSPFDSKYKRVDPMKKGRSLVKKVLDSFKSQEELNMNMLDHVVNQLATAVNDGMSMDVAGLIIIQSYQATSGLIKSAAPFKYISDVFESGLKQETRSTKLYREEHNPPASVVGASILYAIKNNKPQAIMKDIRKNFYQTILSKKDDSLLDVEYAATLPEGTYIGDNPIIRMAMSGINLNTIKNIQTGQSIIDEFGLGVAESIQKFPDVFNLQNKLVEQVVKGETTLSEAKRKLAVYAKFPKNGQSSLAETQNKANKISKSKLIESKVLNINENIDIETVLSKAAGIDVALKLSNLLDRPVKKIRVFDFDDTLATSKNVVFASRGEETLTLNAEEFASRGLQLKEEGWIMDFSDFNKVTDGSRGPLFEVAKTIKEARGNEDLFVLTARAPESAEAIYEFLKAEGLEFKKENIIGLGNSTGEAKANWIIDKAAEGYNDFYFADDAYQNVRAVRDALSVIDVKSKVQQARVKESKKLDDEFNNLLEETTGVEAFKEYSAAKAKTVGASKGRFKFFVPYSAEDFLGLIYPTLAKGSIGDAQMAWYKQNLLDPYTRAQENLSTARINLMQDFKQLKKSLDVPADLRKKNESGFTNEQAVRVFLFDQMGYEVPGLSKRDLKDLKDIVIKDPKLSVFADQILTITKGDGYAKPGTNWLTGTITTDLIDLINTEKRSKYLAEWQQKADVIYSKENLNKLEALYGTKYREALEGVLSRMKSGKNRLNTGNRLSNRILDYINGSVGTIMFFNTRSAVLQTISSINYLNWNFNNPLKAGAAFANQTQYWKDFKMLINSDYLKDRRNGLKLNISESEIADAAATSRNKAKAALNYILQKGYLPTQFADSFAIAAGGATFYRNRVNDFVKQGVELKQAEEQALLEWRQVSEESQQSADPSRISAQQSSDLGRLILAFANTPMQYTRIQKRAIQDLINKRGDAKTNISKVIYYAVVQNIIFNALQQGAFAIGFGDDVEDEVKEEKYLNVANGMLDSFLRGIGIGGQAVSVGKNFLMDIYERSERNRPEYVDAVWKLTQFSPPINSKISKLKQAAWHFDNKKRRQKIFDEGFSLDNPAYEAASKVVSATTNVPLDRVLYKIENIEAALNEDNDLWQRIAMLGGWPKWQLETEKKQQSSSSKRKNIGGIKIKKRKIRIK